MRIEIARNALEHRVIVACHERVARLHATNPGIREPLPQLEDQVDVGFVLLGAEVRGCLPRLASPARGRQHDESENDADEGSWLRRCCHVVSVSWPAGEARSDRSFSTKVGCLFPWSVWREFHSVVMGGRPARASACIGWG